MNIRTSLLSALLCTGIFATSSFATTTLTQTQENDLVYMYQEEKVARDVYRALGDQWDSKTFANIQRSEQKHMNILKDVLEKYDIPVPVIEDTEGVFENETLQSLYEELVAEGQNSLSEALNIGVILEETDIIDLEARMINVPDDVASAYSKLLKGSNSHLRAFNRALDRADETTESKDGKKKTSKKSKKKKNRKSKKNRK